MSDGPPTDGPAGDDPGGPPRRARRRALAGAVATVVLVGLGVWCLTRGVVPVATTGGLLVAPVVETRLVGGWITGGVAALTAAVLAAVDAGGAARTRRRLGG